MTYIKTCRQCNKDFEKGYTIGLPEWGKRKFCSCACKHMSGRKKIVCEQCNISRVLKKSDIRSKFCSMPCRNAYWTLHPDECTTFKNGHAGYRGEKNNPWLGKTLTPEHRAKISQAIRSSPDLSARMKQRGLKMRLHD